MEKRKKHDFPKKFHLSLQFNGIFAIFAADINHIKLYAYDKEKFTP